MPKYVKTPEAASLNLCISHHPPQARALIYLMHDATSTFEFFIIHLKPRVLGRHDVSVRVRRTEVSAQQAGHDRDRNHAP